MWISLAVHGHMTEVSDIEVSQPMHYKEEIYLTALSIRMKSY